ncbi:MAG: amine oxidase [Acidimicrobiia bacterium]|nr:MAG: amine oxidase [Acidimicrobiia bacterium]
MTPPPTSADVVVLGAGPAGLGAAYRLAGRGLAVRVLERAPAVGGLAASFDVAGVRVDHGSHRLHHATPAPVAGTLRALLGDDLQVRTRNGRIRMAGRFVRFPPSPPDLVRRLPPSLSAALARDVVAGRWRGRGASEPRTFDAAVRVALGPTLASRFYAPYVEKLFGLPPAQLSPELFRRRVGARRSGSLVRRAVAGGRARRTFMYPRRGYGQIPEALADAAVAAGAAVDTGSEVTAIRCDEHGAVVETADGRHHEASAVWSTLPLPLVARLAGAPDGVRAAADRLATRAMVLVYLVFGAARWTPYDAHYFPELGVPMSRVSEPKNYRTSTADPRDLTVVCAEVPCRVGDDWWRSGAQEAGERVRDALARESLPAPRPVHTEVRRVRDVYPVYALGHEAAFAAVDAWARTLPRFVHFGRQGLFAHDNTHHALAMAWAAADAARPDGQVDAAAWSRARAAFAAHVVED